MIRDIDVGFCRGGALYKMVKTGERRGGCVLGNNFLNLRFY